ncbi:MAG TPA: hypothetical protein VGV93_05875 [Acidimicrobiales bacterium]|nr:hypothetical protein [Acidimicrobiales bacterium]
MNGRVDHQDPLELLRKANPVDLGRLPRVSESARAQALLEEIIATRAHTPIRFRPRQRRRWIGPGAVGATLVLAAAGYAITQSDATQPLNIGCYEEANLQSATFVVAADGRPPTEVCAEMWPDGAGSPAPELVACVLESGAVGVFPGTGDQTCNRLGLATLVDEYPSDANRDVLVLREALVDRFKEEPCLERDAAHRVVQEELDDLGLSDWRIEDGAGIAGEGFSSARPCAGLAFDAPAKTVTLVPEASPGDTNRMADPWDAPSLPPVVHTRTAPRGQ